MSYDDYPRRDELDYREQLAWSGDDNRDDLTQEDEPECPDCGARFDEPCAESCQCHYCVGRRARHAAKEAV